jgi:tellurite resistance protein
MRNNGSDSSTNSPLDTFSTTHSKIPLNEYPKDLSTTDADFINGANEPHKIYEGTQEDVSDKNTITAEQGFNEAVIKLLVLLYQIDGKVTLTEQDLFDEIIATLNWHSGVSISAFINGAIHQARVAIDQLKAREYLFKLGTGLNYNPAQALEYAMDITKIDGKRSEEEIELLALLSNRVLARGLVE